MPYVDTLVLNGVNYNMRDQEASNDISDLKNALAIGDRTETKDRVYSGKSLITADQLISGGYVSNLNGEIIPYSNWYYSDYVLISDVNSYAAIISPTFTVNDNMVAASDIYYAFYNSAYKFTHGGITSNNNPLMEANSGDIFIRVSSGNVTSIIDREAFMLIDSNYLAYYTSKSVAYLEHLKYKSSYEDPMTLKINNATGVRIIKREFGKYYGEDYVEHIHNDYVYYEVRFDETGIYGVYNDDGEVTVSMICSDPYDTSGNRIRFTNKKLSTMGIAGVYANLNIYLSITKTEAKKNCRICKVIDKDAYVFSSNINSYKAYDDAIYLNHKNAIEIEDSLVSLSGRGYVYARFSNITYEIDGQKRVYSFRDGINDLGPVYGSDDWDKDCLWLDIDPVHHDNVSKIAVLDTRSHSMKIKSTAGEDDLILLAFYDNDMTKPYGELWTSFVKKSITDINSIRRDLTNDMRRKICEKMQSVYAEINSNHFVFGYMSDDHCAEWLSNPLKSYEQRAAYSSMAMGLCDSMIDFDAILHAGDSILTTDMPTASLEYEKGYLNNDKLIYVQGNHDRNIDPEHGIMSRHDFYTLMYRRFRDNPNYHFGKPYDASYYYVDFPDAKVRFVALDLYDIPDIHEDEYNEKSGYRQQQFVWLIQEALVIESNWAVIVSAHSAPVGMTYGNNTINMDLMKTLLEAFAAGSSATLLATDAVFHDGTFDVNCVADFTSQGPRDIIAVMCGHNHWDQIRKINGINYITIACGYMDIAMYRPGGSYWDGGADRTERYKDDYTAIALDVCILDRSNRTMKLKRIGYGADRQITY